MAVALTFAERLVGGGFGYAHGIRVADLDGDGLLEVIAADTDAGLYWFDADRDGSFTRHVIHRRSGEWLERHAVVGIDGDGQLDIVIVGNLGGSVLYFDCLGDPRDPGVWSPPGPHRRGRAGNHGAPAGAALAAIQRPVPWPGVKRTRASKGSPEMMPKVSRRRVSTVLARAGGCRPGL